MCKIREADRAEVAVDTMDGLSVQAISKFFVLLQFSGENVSLCIKYITYEGPCL